ncbi:IucA/IucC family C-terminal-domain containing protein [Neobacillus sp. D3-1R]|uniref:IucA/IucC family C-terminal-domain containing protein n=1 Tax=Neobacillus sp. D3-1R TaxID=3445778 RepID=UPI003FA13B5E
MVNIDTNDKKDITTLLWFRLSEDLNSEPLTIEIDTLLKGDMNSYLQKVKNGICAPNEKVAASMIIKRYAFFAAMSFFTMSHSDRALNVKTSNITLVSHYEDGNWLPKFYFKDLSFHPMQGDRKKWREQYVKDVFAHHIFLLIEKISKTAKISKLILWENIAVYLFWLYENVLESNAERKEIVREDFNYLFFEAPGHLFGAYNHNPLSKYDSKKIYHQQTEKYIRIRKTCCFSYKLEGSNKRCSICPCYQLSEEGRCQNEQSFCSTIRSIDE